ncbi:ssDNA-binding protein [Burkholderia sp. DN3021]|uniref:ssDNA-binding protein n=1 Tax=Burkholderia sp. DN3021 TaxID=3410137 RepID=UPI003C79A23C
MSKNITTPKGSAGYLNLLVPDTRFDPEGKYKASVTLPDAEAAKIIELCKEEAIDELGPKKAAKAKMPGKENEDGTVTFTFKSKSKPKLFDAKGNPIRNTSSVERVGGGSTIRVKGSAKAYENGANIGVTLYLNEVQLIKLVEFGGGFEAVDDEDGFVADNTPAAAETFDGGEAPAEDGPVDF